MRLAVYTSGRQDWGILDPVVAALDSDPDFEVHVLAGGLHLRGAAAAVTDLSHMVPGTWIPGGGELEAARMAGATVEGLTWALTEVQAQALLLVGDRSETLAAGLAATCLKLPIIHLHGGEETEGAIDNACRHALSKLAHLHFTSHEAHARRLRRMGEDPERVFAVGAPSLDRLKEASFLDARDLAARFGWGHLGRPLLAFTYHPTTLGEMGAVEEIRTVLWALGDYLYERPEAAVVMTAPNADAGGQAIRHELASFAEGRPHCVLVDALGEAYLSLLHHADFVVGNSSSGLLEAPSFGIPTLNVGDRQRGRLRGEGVLDVPVEASAILDGLRRAEALGATGRLRGLPNPYGDGRAAERIREVLVRLRPWLERPDLRKAFHDAD